MSAVEDTIKAIQALLQQLQQSGSAAGSAVNSAEESRTRAVQLGSQASVAQLSQLHEHLGAVRTQLGGLTERVGYLLTMAKAIHDGG